MEVNKNFIFLSLPNWGDALQQDRSMKVTSGLTDGKLTNSIGFPFHLFTI